MGLREEIYEQPAVARRLIESGDGQIAPVAYSIRAFAPAFVVIAARGTSDHAALYAQYVFGVRHRLPVALAAPSITSLYGVVPRFQRALVVGISQSGASPDVVGVVRSAREHGALTLAITNEARSPLAAAAEHVIELSAGPEQAVAATKTYTAELVALALLSELLRGRGESSDDSSPGVQAVPEALERALATESAVADAASADRDMSRCVVLGRGYDYATAREWALKLKEIAGVLADPYSAADFQHGPLTLVEPGFPVLAVAAAGVAAADVRRLLERLRDALGARVIVITNDPSVRACAAVAIPLPDGVPEWLLPIVAIVPAQLYAYHLALAKGRDPESPRNLQKVTLTH